jgi:hypothetical protein
MCKRCQFAVNPASVMGHIQRNHKTVTKEQCAQAVAFINNLSQIAQNPEQLKYPDASSPEISGIPVTYMQMDYDACSRPQAKNAITYVESVAACETIAKNTINFHRL